MSPTSEDGERCVTPARVAGKESRRGVVTAFMKTIVRYWLVADNTNWRRLSKNSPWTS